MKNRLKFLGWYSALMGIVIVGCIYYVLVAWIVWIFGGTLWDNWLDRLTFKIGNKLDYYKDLI
jgi:hypothetical protein